MTTVKDTKDKQKPATREDYPELLEKYKRACADYQNLEKRVAQERATVVEFANETLICRLLPILDGLESCFEETKNDGLGIILQQFKSTLVEAGVAEINPVGELFNPEFHEAVGMAEGAESQVVEVVDKGYTLNGRVVRPARVTVGKRAN